MPIQNISVFITILIVCFLHTHVKAASHPANYSEAARLAVKIHRDMPVSFYCGCAIRWDNEIGNVDLESCQYESTNTQAKYIKWGGIVPVHYFAKQLFKDISGKSYLFEPRFIRMQSDLHNLQPVIAELNELRSDYQFDEWQQQQYLQYGRCEIYIDSKTRSISPPENTRGAIARTYLYMKDRYNLKISKQQFRLFDTWNKKYIASEWECRRNDKIKKEQGNSNPYIDRACTKIKF